jgi:hypothetical protein
MPMSASLPAPAAPPKWVSHTFPGPDRFKNAGVLCVRGSTRRLGPTRTTSGWASSAATWSGLSPTTAKALAASV